jgi:cation diffusion facilitator family transporter
MSRPERYQTAKRVTVVNAVINTLLAVFKIIVGYFGRSHALMADGIHSLSDLISDALVLIAAKAGGKIPDKDHPYGHGRIETLAAMIIAIMLLIVGGSIIYETYRHIQQGELTPIHGLPVIIAALISIAAKEWLFRYTLAAGRKVHSNLLITNAYHNRSDVWVSALVVVSAIASLLGIPYADNISAGIIAIIIIKSGLQLFSQGMLELIDTGVDEQTLIQIKNCVQSIPGVVSVHQLRTRSHGGNIFVDSHIIVNTFISVSEGHHIGEKVHEKLVQTFPQIADVTVHIDPENDETNKPSLNLPDRTEILTQLQQLWQDLPGYIKIEQIQIHYFNGQIYLEVCWPRDAIAPDLKPNLQALYTEATKLMPHLISIKLWEHL